MNILNFLRGSGTPSLIIISLLLSVGLDTLQLVALLLEIIIGDLFGVDSLNKSGL